MLSIDAKDHIRGKSQYIDDIACPKDTLNALIFYSKIACGRIVHLDVSEAKLSPGIVAVITAQDIIGENQIGVSLPDEPLLASNEVEFFGQPIAVLVGSDLLSLDTAHAKIKCTYEEKKPLLDLKQAVESKKLHFDPIRFNLGDADAAFASCHTVCELSGYMAGQEHLYLEPQGAIAIPLEKSCMRIISSTQGPSAVQKAVANVLGLPLHKIEVDVVRLGGGFGGKESQASSFAAMAGLAAAICKRAVKLVLPRKDDIRITGKRHPYYYEAKIGSDPWGKILAYEVTFYQDGGAFTDLSMGVLSRSLFHAHNSYHIPNCKGIAYSCKTNTPPHTAFRGFGGPQGMFAIESAIDALARKLGKCKEEIQQRNLLSENDLVHYGQRMEGCRAKATWEIASKDFALKKMRSEVESFNANHEYEKQGLAVMPICFGISFTHIVLNQASALVHVYQDGSIAVSTAAVEMGQGVNTKIAEVASSYFSLPASLIHINSTNTNRIANMSPSAASASADLNGNACLLACKDLKKRLLSFAAKLLATKDKLSIKDLYIYAGEKRTDLTWQALVDAAYHARLNLSSQKLYATPKIFFDSKTRQGHPFAYHVYGTAVTKVCVDILRGIYDVESVDIVHDFGRDTNIEIDKGQVIGALVQGIGWMTCEELAYDAKGLPRSDTLSTYKVPDLNLAPKKVRVVPYINTAKKLGLCGSKAVGEPPFMYGIGTYFALLDAVRSFRSDLTNEYFAPLTPEKIFSLLHAIPLTLGEKIHVPA